MKRRELVLFEGDTLQDGMNKLLDSKLEWATDKEVSDWNKTNKKWVNLFQSYQRDGSFKRLTKIQGKDLKSFYEKGGRLLFLGSSHNGVLNGNSNLGSYSRFLGVKK